MDIGAGLTRQERETIITLNDADDSVVISTSSPVFARKLESLAAFYGADVDYRSAWDVRCTLPKRAVSFSKRRELTEAEKAERAKRVIAPNRTTASVSSHTSGAFSAQLAAGDD